MKPRLLGPVQTSRLRAAYLALSVATFGLAAAPAAAGTSLNHLHLAAADPSAVAEWYRAAFKGELMQFPPGPAVRLAGGLVMTQKDAKDLTRGASLEGFTISTSDIGGVVARARAAGGVVRARAAVRKGRTTATLVDPWGTHIELVDDLGKPGIRQIRLRARNPGAFRQWLANVFGGIPEGRGGDTAVALQDIELVVRQAKPGARGHSAFDHVGLQVDDLAALSEKIKASGYVPGAIRPGALGSTLMFFNGPEGLPFEAVQMPAASKP